MVNLKKLNSTSIFLFIIFSILLWDKLIKPSFEEEVEEKTITIEEKQGSTGKEIVKEYIPYPVYSHDKKEQYTVDKKLKEEYEKLNDSLAKYKKYLEAIKINKYEKTLVDNDTINIKGRATTQGKLLDYSVDYKIKSFDFEYKPEVVKRLPTLSLGLGLETSIPTPTSNQLIFKPELSITNRKGHEISIAYDTDNRVWLGYTKHFKIIK